MAFTKRVLNRGLLAAGSCWLLITATCLMAASLWLLIRYRPDVTPLSLATVASAFAAAAFATLPATSLAAYMAFKSIRCREPPHQCLPIRLKGTFRNATSAAFALTIVPCALGLSTSTDITCAADEIAWQGGLSCYLMRVVWGLSLLMLSLVVVFLLPLRSALATSTLPPTKKDSDTESTASFEKPEKHWPQYVYMMPERPTTREQQRWMQRRNSLSSQKALYPYAFEPRRSATYSMGYGYAPSSHYSYHRSTLRSFSESQPTLCDPHRSGSFSSVSRPVTALSSTGSMYSRRYHQLDPNCPAIPESPKQATEKSRPKTADGPPTLPPPPPPSWCPTNLTHAPLSSDPAIRALTGSPAQPKTLASSTIHSNYQPSPFLTRTTTLLSQASTPPLSRSTTAQTSILNVSRPSTAPSSRSTSTSRSTTSSSLRIREGSPPPIPPLPTSTPPAIPRRATGHGNALSLRTTNGANTIPPQARYLRKPDPIATRREGQMKNKAAQVLGQGQGFGLQGKLWVYNSPNIGVAGNGRYTPSNYSVGTPLGTPVLGSGSRMI